MQPPKAEPRLVDCLIVSILTRPEGRVQPWKSAARPATTVVSILTRPEGRVQLVKWFGRVYDFGEVSILTRPEGRVQRPPAASREPTHRRFQSSPGQKAGCNASDSLVVIGVIGHVSILTRPEGRVQPYLRLPRRVARYCFNPHPARRPGATRASRSCRNSTGVSILTRPEGRVQPLIRAARPVRSCTRFNPHPARRPGATLPRWILRTAPSQCFNPHPARRPGATALSPRARCRKRAVSILTRPEGRVQPQQAPRRGRYGNWFQSSPGQKAGCNYLKIPMIPALCCRFQSSPGQKAGCNLQR